MGNGYIINLQGLRGYAICLIFISHCNLMLNGDGRNVTDYLGALGVSIFIMLSGYLSVFNYRVNDNSNIKSYFKRKFLKFYPLHIITLLVALPFSIKQLVGLDYCALFGLLSNLLLIQSWIPASSIYFSYNAVAWYLSLNTFFICCAYIWKKLYRIDSWGQILMLLVVMEFVLALFFQNCKYNHWLLYVCPLIRLIDYIIGGGVKNCLHKCNVSKCLGELMVFIAIIVLSILAYYSFEHSSAFLLSFAWALPVMLLISGLDVCGNRSTIVNNIFSNKFIVFIGEISFEFFLIHQLIIRYLSFINKYIQFENYIYLIAFCITVCMAYYIHKNLDAVVKRILR